MKADREAVEQGIANALSKIPKPKEEDRHKHCDDCHKPTDEEYTTEVLEFDNRRYIGPFEYKSHQSIITRKYMLLCKDCKQARIYYGPRNYEIIKPHW